MTVTITPVDHGSSPGDDTGEGAFAAFTSVNANEANIKAAIEELQGRHHTIQNASTTVALGKRYMCNNHAGITLTMPAVFAISATAFSDIQIANTDNTSDVTLTPASGDAFFVDGATHGVDTTFALVPGNLVILSPRTTSSEWDLLVVGGGGGSGIGKQTIWAPANAMRATFSNGCASIADIETTAGSIDMQVLDFDTAADEHAQFQIAFPKRWNLGTVTFRVFWTTTATGTTGVAFGLQGVAVSDADTIDTAWSGGTPIVVTDDAQTAAEDLYVSVESAAVTIGGTPADDDVCYFRIFRDVSDANDDMTEDARLIGVLVFFTTDAETDA